MMPGKYLPGQYYMKLLIIHMHYTYSNNSKNPQTKLAHYEWKFDYLKKNVNTFYDDIEYDNRGNDSIRH